MEHHTVINIGPSTLIIEPDPKWRIPTACFYAAFITDPFSVLKYGANSLHFAEHVLWNMTTKGMHHANASTYGFGGMCTFGICLEDELAASIERFYTGFIDLAMCKITKNLEQMYRTELKRVTCETTSFFEASASGSNRMFVFNPDMILSDFPAEFIWRVLLEECSLGRIVINVHCRIDDITIEMFKRYAHDFEEAWKTRLDRIPRTLQLPLYYPPPYSLINGSKSDRIRNMYPTSINPIERMLITFEELTFLQQTKVVKTMIFSTIDQYYYMPALASYSGPIKAKWVDDLAWRNSVELEKKYGAKAVAKAKKLLHDNR